MQWSNRGTPLWPWNKYCSSGGHHRGWSPSALSTHDGFRLSLGETKPHKRSWTNPRVTPWEARLRSSTRAIHHTVLRKLFRSCLTSELDYEINTGKLCLKGQTTPMQTTTYGNTSWVYVCLQVLNWELKEIRPWNGQAGVLLTLQNNFEHTVKAISLQDLCLQGLLETAVVNVFETVQFRLGLEPTVF